MRSITPSRLEGSVCAPPSKSMTVRALAAGLLAKGTSVITNVSTCDDAIAASRVIEELGALIEKQDNTCIIHGTRADSRHIKSDVLHCEESGLTMRMCAPIAGLFDHTIILTASGSLRSRPMDMIDALRQLAVSVDTEDGHAPIRVKGPLKGGRLTIDASVSSQFLTGLLMTLPLAHEDSEMSVICLKSTPYVRMTIALLQDFGIIIHHNENLHEFNIPGRQTYAPGTYVVEGDWSGAAFLLVAGAIAGSVTVKGLAPASLQADRAIMGALSDAGAAITTLGNSVTVSQQNLRAFEFDATDCPDLFPPLVSLAAHCPGKTVIHGVNRLAHKESDRASALIKEFANLGITLKTMDNALEVEGGQVHGGSVDSHGDHRIAMAGAVAALRADSDVIITGDKAVNKSYPDFFTDLEGLQVS
jgi:3-phosphoshikimate 1-carboxyvinyltransferase